MVQTYFRAFGLGVVAGMRSLVAPALLSHKLARTMPAKEPQKPIHYLTLPPVSLGLKAIAGIEILGDKIPNVPDRTFAPEFGARIASGATCGGFLSQAEGADIPVGAVVGGLGTVVGTLAFFRLRQWLTHELGVPDPVVALAEDALAIGVGWSIVNAMQPAPQLNRAQ
ncbi:MULTISPECIES: DUF4126 family protein [Spirosoma]|uniref:DUF4126 family protein n=1 Tax=Spirosoma sordidisoli TaxID=2502893 RepID=A0A4Q2UGU1_9BACT|nr:MULTISPECIES: DUF4126 family protein [Spirosoma]RYC68593.1 DUF4126 family protein [Spirosoma sordidisoli]